MRACSDPLGMVLTCDQWMWLADRKMNTTVKMPVRTVMTACRRMMASKQWKDYSAGNNFEENFLDGAQFRKYLESRRDEFCDFLTHVGLLKK